jgi:hypothetical protein
VFIYWVRNIGICSTFVFLPASEEEAVPTPFQNKSSSPVLDSVSLQETILLFVFLYFQAIFIFWLLPLAANILWWSPHKNKNND